MVAIKWCKFPQTFYRFRCREFFVIAVVVTHNRKKLLAECLSALARQSRPPDRVVVVDNASTDGTGEMLTNGGWVRSPSNVLISLKII